MWGWPAFDNIQIAEANKNPQAAAEREAMAQIEKEGKGICSFCNEEIFKNEALPGGGWTWESEYLLGWCDSAKDHKHKPRVVWAAETGVTPKTPEPENQDVNEYFLPAITRLEGDDD